jgi:hypothetical protein
MTTLCNAAKCGKRINERTDQFLTCSAKDCGGVFHFGCTGLRLRRSQNEAACQYKLYTENPDKKLFFCDPCMESLMTMSQRIEELECENRKLKAGNPCLIKLGELSVSVNKIKEMLKSNENVNPITNVNAHMPESWATVVSKKNKKSSKLSVIVKPKNIEISRKDIQSLLNDKLKPDEIDFNDMRMAKNNGLIYSCENEQDQKKLADEMAKALGEEFEVKIPKDFSPRIKILNAALPDDMDDNEKIYEFLKDRNSELANAKYAKVIMKYQRKQTNEGDEKCFDIILECDGNTYEYYVGGRKIKIGWSAYKVVDGTHVKRCMKCLAYGHKKDECRNKSMACARCGDNHLEKDCKVKVFTCCNCSKVNRKARRQVYQEDHRATDSRCPVFQLQKERRSRITNFN